MSPSSSHRCASDGFSSRRMHKARFTRSVGFASPTESRLSISLSVSWADPCLAGVLPMTGWRRAARLRAPIRREAELFRGGQLRRNRQTAFSPHAVAGILRPNPFRHSPLSGSGNQPLTLRTRPTAADRVPPALLLRHSAGSALTLMNRFGGCLRSRSTSWKQRRQFPAYVVGRITCQCQFVVLDQYLERASRSSTLGIHVHNCLSESEPSGSGSRATGGVPPRTLDTGRQRGYHSSPASRFGVPHVLQFGQRPPTIAHDAQSAAF